jgi:hypothetical protein
MVDDQGRHQLHGRGEGAAAEHGPELQATLLIAAQYWKEQRGWGEPAAPCGSASFSPLPRNPPELGWHWRSLSATRGFQRRLRRALHWWMDCWPIRGLAWRPRGAPFGQRSRQLSKIARAVPIRDRARTARGTCAAAISSASIRLRDAAVSANRRERCCHDLCRTRAALGRRGSRPFFLRRRDRYRCPRPCRGIRAS